MFNANILLVKVEASDRALMSGSRLKDIQADLRRYECDIDDLVLAERFEAACYSRTKNNCMVALIHCRCLLRKMLGVQL